MIKPILFHPTENDAAVINAFKARLINAGASGHAASNQVVLRAALEALSKQEAKLDQACAEGSPV